MISPTDLLAAHYAAQTLPLRSKPRIERKSVLTNLPVGLGDTLMLTDLPRAAKLQGKTWTCISNSLHFRPLMARNPFWTEPKYNEQVFLVQAACLIRHCDVGGGHYLQRIRRAFNLDVDPVPRACIKWEGERRSNRVILHFHAGTHAIWQRQHVHPNARQLGVESKHAIEAFIQTRKDLEFLQIGATDNPIRGAHQWPTPSLDALIDIIGSASWFIGIMSGPLHVATALKLRCVVVINFPEAHKLMLPTLKAVEVVESEWCYPQNVHLHQEAEGPLVPRLTLQSLNETFDGKVYPFWKEDWCNLIMEPQWKVDRVKRPFQIIRSGPKQKLEKYERWKSQQNQTNASVA